MKIMNEEKLREMERFIREYIRENNGDSPKFSQILAHMGMNKSVGYRYLTTLRDRGVINYKGRETLSVKGQADMKSNSKRTAVFGFIPCGSPEDYEDLSDEEEAEVLQCAKDWTLLLQLGTLTKGDWELMWGDCGSLYFYIRKEDLKNCRFDRIWFSLQCG